MHRLTQFLDNRREDIGVLFPEPSVGFDEAEINAGIVANEQVVRGNIGHRNDFGAGIGRQRPEYKKPADASDNFWRHAGGLQQVILEPEGIAEKNRHRRFPIATGEQTRIFRFSLAEQQTYTPPQ